MATDRMSNDSIDNASIEARFSREFAQIEGPQPMPQIEGPQHQAELAAGKHTDITQLLADESAYGDRKRSNESKRETLRRKQARQNKYGM